MRVFKDSEFIDSCPICGKTNRGDAILIGIDGTQEGNNIQAKLFHIKCIELTYYGNKNLIAQIIKHK